MFSKTWISKSIGDYSQKIDRLKAELQDADAILIGAGSSLSTSAGLTYGGERFLKYFSDFHEKYGITDLADLEPVCGELYLWQGDITRLRRGAIVNAANSGMTGCYVPCHACIDNCIHTFAGIQLRLDCAELMELQGHEEPTGQAKITKAYNLPCDYVLHTVGPIIQGRVTPEDERLLASCYRSCLELAQQNGVESIAFCCISTGVFHFPNQRAAEIAVETVRKFKAESGSKMKVIFNVFKDLDFEIYGRLLTEN